MKPAEKIRALIDKSDVTTGSKVDERILGEALQHLEQLRQGRSAHGGYSVDRLILKNPLVKLAVAAAVIISFNIGFFTGRWSKPAQLVPHSLVVTGYTSIVPVYPTAQKAEDSFWRQKALAAMKPKPYSQIQITKTNVIDAYKQYLREKHYD